MRKMVVLLALTGWGCETAVPHPADDCLAVGEACDVNGDCCSYGCEKGGCGCNPFENGLCKTTADCCDGGSRSVVCREYQCADGCRPVGDTCTIDSQCCNGMSCNGAGATCCADVGTSCSAASDCCSGTCSTSLHTCQ